MTKHKPDPQPAEAALKQLGSSAEQAIMIGDTKQDILCAKMRISCPFSWIWSMAIPQGTATGNYVPDYRLQTPEQLIDLISTINDELSQGTPYVRPRMSAGRECDEKKRKN